MLKAGLTLIRYTGLMLPCSPLALGTCHRALQLAVDFSSRSPLEAFSWSVWSLAASDRSFSNAVKKSWVLESWRKSALVLFIMWTATRKQFEFLYSRMLTTIQRDYLLLSNGKKSFGSCERCVDLL